MKYVSPLSICTLVFSSAAIAHPSFPTTSSSVQLYGQIDQGIHLASPSIENKHEEFLQVRPNQLSSSKFGLKGKEDIGGGHLITFYTEGNMFPKKSTNSIFDRRKTLGYENKQFGKVDLGLQASVSHDTARMFDPSGLISKPHTSFDLSGYVAPHRANKLGSNMIKYQKYFDRSKVAFSYQPSNQIGEDLRQGGFAMSAMHTVGDTRIAGSFSHISLPHGDVRIVNAGLVHPIGRVKLLMGGSHSDIPASSTALDKTIRNMGIGMRYAHTRNLEIISATYGEWISDTSGTSQGTKAIVGANYTLSERTKLYSFLSHRRGHHTNPNPLDTVATSLSFGMLHKF